ncbi:hypothetical protein [Ponticaulis sp.]|uniref:hypothetical protein n=1 Tax=Ponticaulis sp. TaxID=2020902 RepID=UPI0026261839|nr:hypothetical protein [Ponticaulis sp.]MDF1680302.1 hypothetical protein [Ponticaulis sp.]
MILFRAFLISLWLILAVYTGFVIAHHGMGLLPIFFGDIGSITWPGQFNLDFFFMLLISGLWTAWRNQFSSLGLTLGFIAVIGGAGFLLPYLLYLSVHEKGDIRTVLIGDR